jgi:MFS family permease
VLGSGNAKKYDSFYVLLFSRVATGCSEAAFQVVAPPLIQDRGGSHAGLWLSVFLTGLPIGLAFGFVYGSRMAATVGWDWAYYGMCIASIPLLVVFMLVKDDINGGILSGAEETTEDVAAEDDGEVNSLPLLGSAADSDANQALQRPEDEVHREHRHFTLFSEVKACFSSPVLVTLSFGWAAVIGVVASLGTFGAAFALALDLFDDERDAAYWFGIAAALAGIIGTPIGGKLADTVLERYGGQGHDDSLRHAINASMLPRINMLVGIALVFIFPTLLMQEAVFFISFLFIGWTLLCKSHISFSQVCVKFFAFG